ncbi:hypothetical protein KSF_108130 [Reticulibacter mediterranei]|uniref:Pentapeptide repeat-containing protein n=1 Tax=Reticulibacter mediterranei TaxID=2778369 RepID=A0A8J3N9M7_9CHLR|nr:pentapeptide repeat-containing protein [Reticulibacter mediterranei]GHP00766.1 hypothetical protein KSF_108130 [Reticulibacter mediterranei]
MVEQNTKRERGKTAEQRTLKEQALAQDNQRAKALQDYIAAISDLLLKGYLAEKTPDDKPTPEAENARTIARTYTISLLPLLDTDRKSNVLQFLYEARLINHPNPIIHLTRADLQGVTLKGAFLKGVNVQGANLRGANLEGAKLGGAYLEDADLEGANLQGAKLGGASLVLAHLKSANLSDARLQEVGPEGNPFLVRAMARKGQLKKANLENAELEGANLQGILYITRDELERDTTHLQGTIMPDGTRHP